MATFRLDTELDLSGLSYAFQVGELEKGHMVNILEVRSQNYKWER